MTTPDTGDLFDELARIIRNRQADHILLLRRSSGLDDKFEQLGKQLEPAPHFTLADPDSWLRHAAVQHRYPLGLLWDSPPRPHHPNHDHLLARLRDLDCQVTYVRCRPEQDDAPLWCEHLRSLGFLPVKSYADGSILFYFDIYDYKLLPSWLNSKYWANPKMWNKARW